MKQLLQNMKNGQTSVEEVPVPVPQRGEVLVHNRTSLVSAGTERMLVEFAEKSLVGKARSRPDLVRQVLDKARREGVVSTLEAAFSRLDQPLAPGYSSAGTVVALGAGVTGHRVGERVACAGGGFAVHAEYVCVPHNLLATLPDQVDFDSAAFTTLGAIALHGFRLAGVQLGEKVVVIGLGLLGMLAAGIVTAAGCHVLGVDVDPQRVALAESLGYRAVQREAAFEAAQGETQGNGFDAVLICADTSSADPVELAGMIARDRARVIAVGAVGLQLPRKIYYEKELTFLNSRSYGPGRYDPSYEEGGIDYPAGYVRWTEGRNLEAVVDLLASGKLDVKPLITHRFPIQKATDAYDLITGKRSEPFLGVLLTYPETEEDISARQSQPITAPVSLSPVDEKEVVTQQNLFGATRLGVLGAGNFATNVMLPALKKNPDIELVGIASASGLNAHHAASRFGFHYATADENKILADPQINTVAILTRHHLHAQQVMAALQARKHVFCEKPLAINAEELEVIKNVLNKVQTNQKAPLLTVGFNRRFAPMTVRLKDYFEGRSEPLFITYRINAGMIPLNHWTQDLEQGGGRIIGEGCHFIDFLVYMVGEAPHSVSAQGLPDSSRYREDNVVMTFSFPDGSLGQVCYLANGDKAVPKERIEVFCGGRVGVLDDFRLLELTASGKKVVDRSRLRQDKGHRAEWEFFSAAIRAGGPPPIPYAQLFGVTKASFAAVQALRSGQIIHI